MKRLLSLFLLPLFCLQTDANTIVYEPSDSLKVIELLANDPYLETRNEWMTDFGKQLEGIPYVGQTLEKDYTENLIINLRQLDCTTFVENVLALTLCMKHNKRSFSDFCNFLKSIRYADSKVSYETRLHYFSSWIESNTRLEHISEGRQECLPLSLFTENQALDINFMSTHANLYPALKGNKKMIECIRLTEKSLSRHRLKYIPKAKLKNYAALKKHILSGDIIAIATKVKGLDISHVGIASWHNDGTLHLLNASQTHKKVIDESMTLYDYMQKHQSQIGIRVLRVL